MIVLKETHRQRPEEVIFLHQKEVPQNFLWFVVCRGASCETKEQTMSSLRAELIQSQQVGDFQKSLLLVHSMGHQVVKNCGSICKHQPK